MSLDEQKNRQKRHLEKKKQAEIDTEAQLGPLLRKKTKGKKPGYNHKRVSQISIIDEFYATNIEAQERQFKKHHIKIPTVNR